MLPLGHPEGGSTPKSGVVILDVIWNEKTKTYYVLDVLQWKTQIFYDCEVRQWNVFHATLKIHTLLMIITKKYVHICCMSVVNFYNYISPTYICTCSVLVHAQTYFLYKAVTLIRL